MRVFAGFARKNTHHLCLAGPACPRPRVPAKLAETLRRIRRPAAALALFLLLAVAFLSSQRWNEIRQLPLSVLIRDPQDFTASEARCLIRALPPSGVVGYLIRADGSTTDYSNPRIIADYFMTQMLLVPRLLNQSPEHRWIVTYLINPAELDDIAARYQARRVADCGSGIAVFERMDLP